MRNKAGMYRKLITAIIIIAVMFSVFSVGAKLLLSVAVLTIWHLGERLSKATMTINYLLEDNERLKKEKL